MTKKFLRFVFCLGLICLINVNCSRTEPNTEFSKELAYHKKYGKRQSYYIKGLANYSEKKYRRAYRFFNKAAKLGDAGAYMYLAEFNEEGLGIEKNIEKAIEYYKLAAEQHGYEFAFISIGEIFEFEYKDFKNALFWYEKAAESKGLYHFQLHVGVMYYAGPEVIRSIKKSDYWFRKFAEHDIGYISWISDDDLIIDLEKAFSWFENEAEKGNTKAQLILSMMYYHGKGVQKDINKAEEWFLLSFINGNQEAKEVLKELFSNENAFIESLLAD
ncbi:MAG: sel1 repeat family protein [Bacteroidales bacterium]|nr:sel1 repeat family protein [Bacteroidales bacterium]